MFDAQEFKAPVPGTSLGTCSPLEWARLIDAINPASMIVVIDARMGEVLRARTTAEDLWQETLLSAWKDREHCVWQELPAFRRWMLQVAHNRLLDAADREGAGKRSPHAEAPPPGGDRGSSSGPLPWEPAGSTTPSRVAQLREQAEIMRRALDGLEPELRDVIRLRNFEGKTSQEVAETLGIGLAAVKHRYRRGAQAYARLLRDALKSRSRVAGDAG